MGQIATRQYNLVPALVWKVKSYCCNVLAHVPDLEICPLTPLPVHVGRTCMQGLQEKIGYK